jgi:hypothetical protein
MIKRPEILLLLSILLSPVFVQAQSRFFAGGIGGIATLSADGQTLITPESVAFSTYRPSNGAALNVFAGAHLNNFLSLQGNYIWNRNQITVTSSKASSDSLAVSEEKRGSSQHGGILDLLLYFRNRESWVRPYLSAGSGVVHFKSDHREWLNDRGTPARLPIEFTSTELALRVAVGIDIAVGRQSAVRYSFSETIRKNPISSRQSPPGERNLANFQNLFGIVKYF